MVYPEESDSSQRGRAIAPPPVAKPDCKPADLLCPCNLDVGLRGQPTAMRSPLAHWRSTSSVSARSGLHHLGRCRRACARRACCAAAQSPARVAQQRRLEQGGAHGCGQQDFRWGVKVACREVALSCHQQRQGGGSCRVGTQEERRAAAACSGPGAGAEGYRTAAWWAWGMGSGGMCSVQWLAQQAVAAHQPACIPRPHCPPPSSTSACPCQHCPPPSPSPASLPSKPHALAQLACSGGGGPGRQRHGGLAGQGGVH